MADIGRLEGKIDVLSGKVENVSVVLAGMMPRAEVDGELARRVSNEAYVSDQREVNSRLTRLEASPMKLLAYLGAVSGCLGVLSAALIGAIGITVTAIGITFGVVEFIITHH
jgi:hypothetical protein